jgi:hypothetical protein
MWLLTHFYVKTYYNLCMSKYMYLHHYELFRDLFV